MFFFVVVVSSETVGTSESYILRELQNGQSETPTTGRIYECNRTDDRVGKQCVLTTCGENSYMNC